jgi:hypothetical protein
VYVVNGARGVRENRPRVEALGVLFQESADGGELTTQARGTNWAFLNYKQKR